MNTTNMYHNPKILPDELHNFNWGAFLLPIIWGVRFRAWITLLVIPIILIHLSFPLKWILFVGFQIYCGLNGNKWVYEKGGWKDKSILTKAQIRWAIFAILLNILLPFVILCGISDFLAKDIHNPQNFMRNALCKITYNNLKNNLPDTVFTSASVPSDITKQLAKNNKNAKMVGDSIIYNSNKFSGIFYSITVYKPEYVTCTLYNNNCYIDANYVQTIETDNAQDCRYIFDDKKDIMPDENTIKAIQKGMNIFNYL